MNRFEVELKAIEQRMQERVAEYQAVFAKCDEEDRKMNEREAMTVAESQKALEMLKDEHKTCKSQLEELKAVEELGRTLGPAVPSLAKSDARVGDEGLDRWHRDFAAQTKSLGEQFTDSGQFKSAVQSYREAGRLPMGWSTGAVGLDAKGTLLEGAGGGGGALAATVPQVVPGVVDKLFQRLSIADLLMSGQASTNSIRYVVEGTATSGAAGVAEGGTKPESALGLTTTDEPIKKIATILPVSEEMLEDAPAIQSYINGRLVLFVKIEEERQLLRGTSGGAEVQGLLTSRNVPVYAGGTAVGNRAVQLFKAMNGMRGSAFVEPEWIVMNPADYEIIRLLQDNSGQFYGGGPFQGPYAGTGQNVDASNQLSNANDIVWSKPVVVTAAVGAGTAIVGSRASAQVWRRGGLSVEATNSHSNYFQLNLVAIRAEERLGLAVYRPQGFVEVRLS